MDIHPKTKRIRVRQTIDFNIEYRFCNDKITCVFVKTSNEAIQSIDGKVLPQLPSSRGDEFYKECRFDSLEAAIGVYNRWN